MNPFQSYLLGFHVWSLFIVGLAFLYCLHRTKLLPPLIRIIVSLGVCQSGNLTYELFMAFFGTDTRESIPLYTLLLTAVLSLLYLIHLKYPCLKTNLPSLLTLFFIEICFFEILTQTDFFLQCRLWNQGLAPDPHDLVWALSKSLSFFLYTPLIEVKTPD